MPTKSTPDFPPTVKVIRDCRNAEADYTLPRKRALDLYHEGKLHWDTTNGAYCHPTTDSNQRKFT